MSHGGRFVRIDVESAGDDVRFRQCVTLKLANDAAVIHDGYAVAAADELIIVGRIEDDGSTLVGKPVAQLLLERHATVTMCHSRTRDLGSVVREGDIVVAALGRPELVKGDWIKEGAGVIVVINRPMPDALSQGLRIRSGAIAPRDGEQLRDYGVGAQILAELGVHDMILLTNSHHTPVALAGYGLAIVGERPIPLGEG